MALYAVLTPDQLALEHAADALLATLPPDPERPAYTDRQLLRRGRRLIAVDDLADFVVAPSQALRDEVRFLASVSRLDADSAACLRLWNDGWSQQEIAAALNVTQQCVSLRLRRALRRCYDAAPLSFRRFSRHTIYRPPSKARRDCPARRCARCGESYPPGLGIGRYCSTSCREIAAREGRNLRPAPAG